MSQQPRDLSGEDEPETSFQKGRKSSSAIWTIVAILVVAAIVGALALRYHNNATSTVNPHKTQPGDN